ncbi:MAG: amidohydrolase family protein [Planctomycetes bacterium]|nr:amidohydrolase family protein [Planctomycetota bacterium]
MLDLAPTSAMLDLAPDAAARDLAPDVAMLELAPDALALELTPDAAMLDLVPNADSTQEAGPGCERVAGRALPRASFAASPRGLRARLEAVRPQDTAPARRPIVRRASCWSALAVLAVASIAMPRARGGDHATEIDADRKPALVTRGNCVVRNVTIHTATKPAFVGDVWVRDGKIAAVGKVEAPAGVLEVDGTGKHLAPGVVDCHSHIAVDGDVNEGTVSISAEVSIEDVIDADDPSIYRALAGGVTTARILHGSANAIGGRDEVLKLKFRRKADELRFPGGPAGIKFALGENPKRSNGSSRGERFPASRLGVEAVFYRAFERAREYQREWNAYSAAKQRGEDPEPPRKDVRLDVLAGILRGEVLVHSHCYRADEILMLLRASQEFGFQIATLQHVLEGYKVAYEMAEAKVAGSTFGDWWAYKIEAYDAIPQNAALMDRAGVSSSLNSDSAEMMRRLYGEAAKSVRYAGLDPVRALALVTLNPARQLGIAERIGSIEAGKDADLVLLSGDPLSSLSRVLWTMVDGEVEFERKDAFGLESRPPQVPALTEAASPSSVPPETGDLLALVGATLHPITSPDVERGTIVVRGGRIVALGASADVALPAGARVVDATGKHVWPGMVSFATNLGLYEIGSVPATDDQGESGGSQPDVRTTASINADSAHIGVTRVNGITRVQTAPQSGGPIRGQSAIVRLAGDTWEEMLTVDRDMLHVRFPATPNEAKKKEKTEEVKELEKTFEAARDYARRRIEARDDGARPRHDAHLEALAPYARGEKKVALYADNAQTILFALRFAREQELAAVIVGAREGWKVAEELARSRVPVVVGPVLDLPGSRYDPYDAAFANAAVLARAGVPFAIMSDDPENARNLAFHAAMACAYGLPHEEALRAVTYYPARVLGIEKELGSLAVGKIADLVVTDGDLLEIRSRVEQLYVDGRLVPLVNRQSELHDKYRERLERLQAASKR